MDVRTVSSFTETLMYFHPLIIYPHMRKLRRYKTLYPVLLMKNDERIVYDH